MLKYTKIIPIGIVIIAIIVLGYNFAIEPDLENVVEEQSHDERIEFIIQNIPFENVIEKIVVDGDGKKTVLIEGLIENDSGQKIKIGLHTMIDEDGDEKIRYVETDYGKIFKILTPTQRLSHLALYDQFDTQTGMLSLTSPDFALRDNSGLYENIGFFSGEKKPLVIIPTFTAAAYSVPGFYTFYEGKCDMEFHGTLFRDDDCLTTNIPSESKLTYHSSVNAVKILRLLEYDLITDLELHQNPNILQDYDKIIMLHNEYVTKIMFDAITSHNNVVFLYPNALYAEVSVDEINNTITLIRGHNYPEITIRNGFDWKYDNTRPFEFDTECSNWEFYTIPNGHMLNCYPEKIIWNDESLLKYLKDL